MKTIAIAIALILLTEYYCFTAFVTGFSGNKRSRKKWAVAAYLIFTVIGWAALLTFREWYPIGLPKNIKAVLTAFVIGFLLSKILITLFLLLGDIARAGTWTGRKIRKNVSPHDIGFQSDSSSGKISRSTFLARFALLMGGLAFGLVFWGITNRYRYQLIKIRLAIKGLPDALKGLRIVQISDIHSGSFDNEEAVARGVEMAMAQKPDLIVFTGDLVNNKSAEIEPYLNLFGKLKAPLGVFSTLGNHDYGDYVKWPSEAAKTENLEKLKQHEAAMGWQLLNNEHVILQKNGQDFALIGVENWSASPRFPRKGNLQKAYQGLEEKPLPLKILLSHDPSHWDAQINTAFKDIDVTLSGHTHGMQFGVEIPGFKWSPAKYFYKQWAGLYSKKSQYLYVNRGYGFIGYQGRVGILPEVTVIELV